MSIYSDIIVFQIIWWIVFFMALPIGVRIDQEAAAKGFANSAPQQTGLRKKLLYTTGISIILWAITHVIIVSDIIPIE